MSSPDRPRITVVGLGPAGPEHVGRAALDAMAAAPAVFLRTRHHPAAAALGALPSFDSLYEGSGRFEEVYEGIVERLVASATEVASASQPLVYAVPGSPLVAERTVELLRLDPRVDVTIVPTLSFLDLVWDRLGIDPVGSSVRLVDATAFEVEAAGDRGPLVVAQCWSTEVLSAVKLSLDADGAVAAPRVTLLHHLGLPDEQVVTVDWWDMDRDLRPDHLTTLWVPQLAAPVSGEVARLVSLVRVLRQQCPWDREQTHATLTRHLLEESYEAVDAIERLVPELPGPDEGWAGRVVDPTLVSDLCEELGDVLFQVVFHSVLAGEEGLFTLSDVAAHVHHKLVGRHPHVFADVVAETPDAVAANWEDLKKAEKGRTSITEGIPAALPALALATKLQRKAESAGLPAVAPATLRAEVGEALVADDSSVALTDESVGSALMALAELARRAGVDPEASLRRVALALRQRIVAAERRA